MGNTNHKKRGPKPSSPICRTLVELLASYCPKNYYPWQVVLPDGSMYYCYAKTKQEASRRVVYRTTKCTPCSLDEIFAAKKNLENGAK